MVGVNIRSRYGYTNRLWSFFLVCDEPLNNLKVGNIDVYFSGLWLKLFIEVFTNSVCNIGMNRLKKEISRNKRN